MKIIRILAVAALCLFAGTLFAQTATATHSTGTVIVTVNPAPVAALVTATAAPNPTVAGTSVIVTANVASPTAGGVVPTGTVNFYNGSVATGTLIASTPLSNGSATCTLSTTGVAPGPITVTAQFMSATSLYF